MPKRLAITISGAVSLGSYESGVMYEVLDAIQKHNAGPAAEKPDDQIQIDVITGASAGGMTATILAQKLLYNGDLFKGPYDNPLYNTWVKGIDLDGLLKTANTELATHSIFSSDLIAKIANDTLLSRWDQKPVPKAKPHAAAGNSIRLGVALTNLNGIDFERTVIPDQQFIYTEFGDQRTRFVESAKCDNKAFWEPLAESAIACGAFPFAFRSRDVSRSLKTDVADFTSDDLVPWTTDPTTFTYSDGGIIQNQPLGMAKNLVDLIDDHQDQDSRYYLFISPNAKESSAKDHFCEANADYLHLLERLAGVVLGQAQFRDWITAEQINAHVAMMDKRACQLAELIPQNKLPVDALQATATSLLALLYPTNEHLAPGADTAETLDHARKRITLQYNQEIVEARLNKSQKTAFIDSMVAFEAIAGLGNRDQMTIYGVTANDSELAGAGLHSFLGFFKQDYRDHDYDVGRDHARKYFALVANSAHPGLCGYLAATKQQEPIHPVDHRFDGLTLAKADPQAVAAFKTGLTNRLNQALKQKFGFWSVVADPVADKFLELLVGLLIHSN